MGTEPTLLFKIFDLLLQIVVFVVITGGFVFFLWLVNCFLNMPHGSVKFKNGRIRFH